MGLSRKGKLAIAAPLIAIVAIFYAIFPELFPSLPRVPAIIYMGTVLVLLTIWLLMSGASLVQKLR